MITKFITSVSTTFSPFNARSGKTARSFLALLPPNARQNMKIDVKMLPRAAPSAPSASAKPEPAAVLLLGFKDGKQMSLDLEKLKIKDVQEEVDRHSRLLARQEELTGN
ncbi:hypothetical protein BJ546DRAFT_322817 [Cryomyces antarcticus]